MSKASQSLRRSLLKTAGAAASLRTWVPEVTGRSETGPYSGRSDEHVRIGNDQLELAFRRDNGGLDQVTTKRTQGSHTLAPTCPGTFAPTTSCRR